MPQAVKRFHGTTTSNSATSIYTCPASTIAKVQFTSITLAYGFIGIHTSTSSSQTYGIIRNPNNDERTLMRSGTGELVLATTNSTLRLDFSPTFAANYWDEGIKPIAYSRASGNQVSNAGTDYRSCGYMGDVYMSPSQILDR